MMRIHRGLYLGLFLLVACSSGGGSGSSAPRTYPIPEIHGLWLEADACNCQVHPIAEKELAAGNVAVRCYHYFVASGGVTRAISGYVRFGSPAETNPVTAETAQSCGTERQFTQPQANALRREFNRLASGNRAFFLPDEQLPNGIGSVTYATAAMRNGSDAEVTIERTGHSENGQTREGKNLDFIYANNVARILASEPGGNGIICSSYWKKNANELYLGVPGDRHDRACRQVGRYLNVERYRRAP